MNKSNRTILAVLLLLLVATSSLFAQGMKEANPEAVTLRVVATFDQYGEKTFIAKDTDGNEVIFNAGTYTESNWPVSSIVQGDYIEAVLVYQMASEIRWITPLVTIGVLPVDISLESESPLTSLEERFSYTYGYLLIQSFATQGLFFDAGYYTKGALDGHIDSQSEVQIGRAHV